jgi:hypothetical protein
MSRARATWIVLFVLAVLWFTLGIVYEVGDDLGLLILVVCVVVIGSLLANLAYGGLQITTERLAAARMEELRIPRQRLVDALMSLSPQDVALLTAKQTQKLAQDLALPGGELPVSRLAGHSDLLRAVRQYVDNNSDNLKFWPDAETPNSLRETVEATERIVGELQQHTDRGNLPNSMPRREIERYAGQLTAQSGAFHQIAGAA